MNRPVCMKKSEKEDRSFMEYSDIIIFIMELVGTVAFAASGALTAIQRRMDLFGVNVLGVTTAVGGGMIRDLILGQNPPAMFLNSTYAVTAIVTSTILFFCVAFRRSHGTKLHDRTERMQRTDRYEQPGMTSGAEYPSQAGMMQRPDRHDRPGMMDGAGLHGRAGMMQRPDRDGQPDMRHAEEARFHRGAYVGLPRGYDLLLLIGDTIGLGIFTVVGSYAAVRAGYGDNRFLILFVGVLTGVGGGMLRDIMAGNMPYILVKHVYAVASLAGALTFTLLLPHLPRLGCMVAGATVVMVIRFLAAYYHWNLPRVH